MGAFLSNKNIKVGGTECPCPSVPVRVCSCGLFSPVGRLFENGVIPMLWKPPEGKIKYLLMYLMASYLFLPCYIVVLRLYTSLPFPDVTLFSPLKWMVQIVGYLLSPISVPLIVLIPILEIGNRADILDVFAIDFISLASSWVIAYSFYAFMLKKGRNPKRENQGQG